MHDVHRDADRRRRCRLTSRAISRLATPPPPHGHTATRPHTASDRAASGRARVLRQVAARLRAGPPTCQVGEPSPPSRRLASSRSSGVSTSSATWSESATSTGRSPAARSRMLRPAGSPRWSIAASSTSCRPRRAEPVEAPRQIRRHCRTRTGRLGQRSAHEPVEMCRGDEGQVGREHDDDVRRPPQVPEPRSDRGDGSAAGRVLRQHRYAVRHVVGSPDDEHGAGSRCGEHPGHHRHARRPRARACGCPCAAKRHR